MDRCISTCTYMHALQEAKELLTMYIHTYIHTYIRVCVLCVCHTHVCVNVCVNVYVCVCVCVHVCACVYTCIHTYIHTHTYDFSGGQRASVQCRSSRTVAKTQCIRRVFASCMQVRGCLAHAVCVCVCVHILSVTDVHAACLLHACR